MVAEALATNFLCSFRVLQELYTDQGCSFDFCLMQEVLQCLGMSNVHQPPAPAIGWYGEVACKNSQGAPMKSHCITPKRSG